MSSAATIHDGCGSLVNLLLLCIILIVSMSISHIASTCIFILHLSHTLMVREQKQPNRLQICHFENSFEADLLNICVKFGGWITENDKI